MSISADKRNEVLLLLRDGKQRDEIAAKVGVPLKSVDAVKAHITMGRYQDSVTVPERAAAADEILDDIETTFSLERDLQTALRANISQLEGGLSIHDGGKEKQVPSGRIDILATDAQANLVVIELKAGTADRDAIAQLLSYIGDLQVESERDVRGILIASDFTARAIAASKASPKIELRKYGISFNFKKVLR